MGSYSPEVKVTALLIIHPQLHMYIATSYTHD